MGLILGVLFFFYVDFFQFTAKYHIRENLHQLEDPLREYTHKVGSIVSRSARKLDLPLGHLSGGIPAIIHQTWESTRIPTAFVPWMKSWAAAYQEWHYVFWTPDGAQAMISTKFPVESLSYSSYPLKLQKLDARRYFVMYEYGGIFVDLDMESLRGMDDTLKPYSCVLAQHPIKSVDNRVTYVIANNFLACRPHHPFYKFVLDALSQYQIDHGKDILSTTGYYFLSSVLEEYVLNHNKTEEEYIHVLPANIITSAYSETDHVTTDSLCAMKSQVEDRSNLCDILRKKGRHNGLFNNSTKPYWHQIFNAHFAPLEHTSIFTVLDNDVIV